MATLNRDLSNTNTMVGKGPDLNNVLGEQADMMAAATPSPARQAGAVI